VNTIIDESSWVNTIIVDSVSKFHG